MLKLFTAVTLVAGTVLATATPAAAESYTFAQYQTLAGGSNLYWKNSGSNGASGTSADFYTIADASKKVPGSRDVSFSFLQPSISPYVTNVTAAFTLSATVTATPAMLAGSTLIQENITGSFSFVTTTAMTVGSNFFAAGSNLLSGTFSSATVSGARLGSSGSFSGSSISPAATIVYTSDFLSFDPSSSYDFSLSLTSITSALQAIPTSGAPNRALRTFRATSTGSFSADPAPVVTAVPEPAVWGLMILGFSMVGMQTRRRSRRSVIA